MVPSLVVVGCGMGKRTTRSPAKAMYLGKIFRSKRTLAERWGAPWLILSAKHGLVEPDVEIDPYDLTMRDLTAAEHERWTARVVEQLRAQTSPGDVVCVLAGRRYVRPLRLGLPDRVVWAPFEAEGDGLRFRGTLGKVEKAINAHLKKGTFPVMKKKQQKHGVHPQLESLVVPIDSLTEDPRNARGHDERNIQSVMQSYSEHGQRKPIVVKLPERIVEAGNGQLEAARRLGWTHIAAVLVDEDDRAARKYALRDNRTAELATWDLRQLSADLREMKEAGEELEALGWNAYEAEPLLVADWKPPGTDPNYKPPGSGDGSHQVRFSEEQWAVIGPKIEIVAGANDCSMAAAIVSIIQQAVV